MKILRRVVLCAVVLVAFTGLQMAGAQAAGLPPDSTLAEFVMGVACGVSLMAIIIL